MKQLTLQLIRMYSSSDATIFTSIYKYISYLYLYLFVFVFIFVQHIGSVGVLRMRSPMQLPELQLASPLSSLSPPCKLDRRRAFLFFQLISKIIGHILFYKLIAMLTHTLSKAKVSRLLNVHNYLESDNLIWNTNKLHLVGCPTRWSLICTIYIEI